MAQYSIADDRERLEQCPFDSTHMIRAGRMPYHIMDCRKNFKHLNYKQCPFNARHWVKGAEFEYHKANCKDRAIVETELRNRALRENQELCGEFQGGDCSLPDYCQENYIIEPSGDDWDAECDNDRKAFCWGKDSADEYFSNAASNSVVKPPAEPQRLRLPHGVPEVLKQASAESSAQNLDRTKDQNVYPVTQRLPNSLPKAYTGGLGGVGRGRGRGYGSTNQGAAPKVGMATRNGSLPNQDGNLPTRNRSVLSAANNHVSQSGSRVNGQSASTTNQMFLQEKLASFPQRAGRGRGYGAIQAQPVGAKNPRPGAAVSGWGTTPSDDDISSSSDSSSGITRGGGKRRVNAAPLFNPSQARNAPPPSFVVPKVPVQSDNSAGQKKSARKYEKKIREIEAIERKREHGIALNSDEESKLQSKDEIVRILADLRIGQD